MNEELNKALDEISDAHICEAAAHKKQRRPYWLGPVAAVLALALAAGAIWRPAQSTDPVIQGTIPTVPTIQGTTPTEPPAPSTPQSPGVTQLTGLVAAPVYPKMAAYPQEYTSDAYEAWRAGQRAQYDQPMGYADSLTDFFAQSIPELLSGEGNRAYSPVNLYMALAMLAETTGGNSRQQILDLLGLDSIEALRTQAGHVWNAHYGADGLTTSLLANSLWLDEMYSFNSGTVNTLADSYFASVFHGDLGTEEMDEALRQWLNAQTSDLLREQAKNTRLDPATVFALASTIYFSANWQTSFLEAKTADGLFHCPDHDLVTAFMHRSFTGNYYRGAHFGAVSLGLEGNNTMWLILPDEGASTQSVLESGEYLALTRSAGAWENQHRDITVNLSLPKFDISSQNDLAQGVRNLGVTDVFDPIVSDFTPITDTTGLFVNKIDHAARVVIDEEGIIAAAYTVIDLPCAGIPAIPEEKIDFTLDRPFIFVISSRNGLPLFAGVVEQP